MNAALLFYSRLLLLLEICVQQLHAKARGALREVRLGRAVVGRPSDVDVRPVHALVDELLQEGGRRGCAAVATLAAAARVRLRAFELSDVLWQDRQTPAALVALLPGLLQRTR